MARKGQRGGGGRKVIDTSKLIQDPAARQVTFSKRRKTLFKTVDDLAANTGAKVALVGFSPGGKAYGIGSPSVEAVFRRLNGAALPVEEEEEHAARVVALRQELEDTKALVKEEQARMNAFEADVKRAMEAAGTDKWWKADVNKLCAASLPYFLAALRRFRDAVQRHAGSRHAADQNGTATTSGRVDALTPGQNNA